MARTPRFVLNLPAAEAFLAGPEVAVVKRRAEFDLAQAVKKDAQATGPKDSGYLLFGEGGSGGLEIEQTRDGTRLVVKAFYGIWVITGIPSANPAGFGYKYPQSSGRYIGRDGRTGRFTGKGGKGYMSWIGADGKRVVVTERGPSPGNPFLQESLARVASQLGIRYHVEPS
jgi:hypothetical protein